MRATIFGAALLAGTALLAVAPAASAQQYGGYGSPYGSSYGSPYGGLGGYGSYGSSYGSLGGYPSAAGYGAVGYGTAYPGTAGYGTSSYGTPGQVSCQYAGQYPGYC